MTLALHQKDAIDFLKSLADNSIDAIVTDPPYGLTQARPGGRSEATRGAVMGGFMGLKWDCNVPSVEVWAEALRVLKPGGHVLSFGGTRTYHRLVCAIEDAGFEIRDQIGWTFGSGFPKSHNGDWGGTALKPAWEPICMARKPLEGTVEENWKKWGTGALNIDGCRISTDENLNGGAYAEDGGRAAMSGDQRTGAALGMFQAGKTAEGGYQQPAGRWPANLIHDGSDEVLAAFPDAPGQLADASSSSSSRKTQSVYGAMKQGNEANAQLARIETETSASRFFFSPAKSLSDDVCKNYAPTATVSSGLQNGLAYIAQNAAAIWESLAGIVSDDSTEPSTIVTPTESKLIENAVIQAILYIASGYSPECKLERHSPCGSHASVVAIRKQTGITTITASLFRSGGCVDAATYSITPTNMDLGEAVCRFKYCPKASKSDREEGLEGFAKTSGGFVSNTSGQHMTRRDEGYEVAPRANNHPTVKPTDLMRYLCRLVTPPGGTVLDFYMGSGSTGKAAVLEGFHFIGNDREADYVEIARARIEHAVRFGDEYEAPKPKAPDAQTDLFGT